MRSLRYGIEVKVSKETILCDEDGNTILNDNGIKKQIEYQSGRAVRNLFLVSSDSEEPVLCIEWEIYWREDEEDRITLDHFACSDRELLECYRLGVL